MRMLIKYSIDLAENKFSHTNNTTLKKNTGVQNNNPTENLENYNKYIGAIIKYNKPGYGVGYIKSIQDDKVTISFSNNGNPFVRTFLTSALNNSISIIKLEDF